MLAQPPRTCSWSRRAGAPGAFSAYIPGWGARRRSRSSEAVTKRHPGQGGRDGTTIEILDPTVEPRQQPLTYVPRPDSLQGKRVGLVENTKFNSDQLLLTIGEILEQRVRRRRDADVAQAQRGRARRTPRSSRRPRRTVDVVVAGIGD